MRAWAAILGFALLGGCDAVGAPEPMSLADARANLVRVAGAGSAEAFCTEDGRRVFRRAVRTFSAAVVAKGADTQFMGMGEQPDEAWALVSMGVLARIVEPSDLRGSTQAIALAMNFPGATIPDLAETRDAMEHACPELIAFYREAARFAEMRRRAEHDGDDMSERRARRHRDRLNSQQERVRRAAERLQTKMRASGWEGQPDAMDPVSMVR